MFLKLFVLSALICNVFCYTIYSYQLPDAAEQKSLNVIIDSRSSFQIKITCYNYDSLNDFEVRQDPSTRFELRNGILLEFNKCFKNASNLGNNKYELFRWFNSLPYFSSGHGDNGYPITFRFDEYAEANGDVLFRHFDFRKFNSITFINLGFVSTNFFNHLYCPRCKFQNNGVIDFNSFSETIAETNSLDIHVNKLVHLNRANLRKFIGLETLQINNFDLDDYNTFNVPDLFEYNGNIQIIEVKHSKEKISLDEHVFRGLNNLRELRLVNLKIDFVPKDLLKNLKKLKSAIFASNNIKTVDPATFQTTSKLTHLSFIKNPFYTEPHDKLEEFHLAGERIRMNLGNFTEHTFDLLDQLSYHPNLQVTFESFRIKQFNVTTFTNIFKQRNSTLFVTFGGGEPELDLEYIKSLGNIIRKQSQIAREINAKIRIKFKDAMCHDCTIIKYLYPYYIKGYKQNPGFYFEDSHLFIRLELHDACYHLNDHFEQSFTVNCPINCACRHNSIVDKVIIVCDDRNLTQIPVIPYPDQFANLHSIDLSFVNNSIQVLSFANQDVNVTRKISTLNLKNNKIKSFEIEEVNLPTNIRSLNLCDNPFLEGSDYDESLSLNLASGLVDFDEYSCSTRDGYPQVEEYIKYVKSSSDIGEYLNGVKCN